MNMNAHVSAPETDTPSFLSLGLDALAADAKSFVPLLSAFKKLEGLASVPTQKKIRSLIRQTKMIEPSLTMIGQIKSGKTTLINAMIGRHDLLPADVNPWTSVVTTLHLSPMREPHQSSAIFEFFEDTEWARLIRSGGRMGELAERAGAEGQLAKVKQQIEDMREKSKTRLGRNFEFLLGQNHQYGYVDQELIQRYVCLGDDFESELNPTDQTGRFADITKSAILHLAAPHLPLSMSIRDTPGINDTFMMREQITLQSIRESRMCAVVLSAHQALSTDDLALIRLITNAKSRDVVIFVNRIDELENPLIQVEQIKKSIRDTLLTHRAPVGVEIIFGSALWANAALKNSLDSLPADSKSALLNWADSPENRPPANFSPIEMLWYLSGIPKLNKVLAQRMSETVIIEERKELLRKVKNIADGIRAQDNYSKRSNLGATKISVSSDAVSENLKSICRDCAEDYEQAQTAAITDLTARLDRAIDGFLSRATDALIEHLETYGDEESWSYDPTGLRILLASAYRAFEKKYLTAFEGISQSASHEIARSVENVLGLEADTLKISAPSAVRIPPPIAIGRTIALDLHSSWWKSWWIKRRGYASQTSKFRQLIEAEVRPVAASLLEDVKKEICDVGDRVLAEFLQEQVRQWTEIAQKAEIDAKDLERVLDLPTLKKRHETLSKIDQTLAELAL